MIAFLFLGCGTNSNSNENQVSIHKKSKKKIIEGDSVLQSGWYYVVDSGKGYKRKLEKTEEYYFIAPIPIVAVEDFTTLQVNKSNISDSYVLTIHFNDTAAEAWSIATGKSIGNRLAFILDNKLLFTPMVNAQITKGIL